MSTTQRPFRVQLCRIRSGAILGTSTLLFWSLTLAISGCMGSPENGNIGFQPYNDNPYYNSTSQQTPGWLQIQAPSVVSVGQSFTIQALARDTFGNAYMPPVPVTMSVINMTTSTASAPLLTSTSNGLAAFAPMTLTQSDQYQISIAAPGFATSSQLLVVSGTPTQLILSGTTGGQLNTSSCTPFRVSTADSSSLPATTPALVTVSFSVTANEGGFYQDVGCTTALTTAQIPAGSNTATFYYSDDAQEQFTISASASGLTAASLSMSTLGQTIFVLGGYNTSYLSNIEESTDGGTTYHLVATTSGFPSIAKGNAIVFNHAIYYFGGLLAGVPTAHIYVSPDGINWNLLATPMPQPLHQGAVVVWNQKIWYLGGYDNAGNATSTVFSFDGTTVNDFTPSALFPSIAAEAAFVLGNTFTSGNPKVVVVGGATSTTLGSSASDVYSSGSASLSGWVVDTSAINGAIPSGLSDMGYAFFNNALYLAEGLTGLSINSNVFTSTTNTGYPWLASGSISPLIDAPMVVHLNSVEQPALSIIGGALTTNSTIFTAGTQSTTDGSTWNASGSLTQGLSGCAAIAFTPGL